MDVEDLGDLLTQVRTGAMSVTDATARLQRLPYADLGHARIDHHRSLRQGIGEVIYGPGKSPDQCVEIVSELLTATDQPVVLTRVSDAQRAAVMAAHDGARRVGTTLVWRPAPAGSVVGTVAVVTAGTADLAVADECAVVLEAHGVLTTRINDVGVAGLHRVLSVLDELYTADVVVVAAGMEGALASVVGGLVAAPVIAVPTSVGYGASLEGVTALLSMLAGCAAGVTVVGIDNGFGAAMGALRLLLAAASVTPDVV